MKVEVEEISVKSHISLSVFKEFNEKERDKLIEKELMKELAKYLIDKKLVRIEKNELTDGFYTTYMLGMDVIKPSS